MQMLKNFVGQVIKHFYKQKVTVHMAHQSFIAAFLKPWVAKSMWMGRERL